MKRTCFAFSMLLATSLGANAANRNPAVLKKGGTLWFQCDIESAQGQWAIQYFPVRFDLYLGEVKYRTDQVVAWDGHISFQYRNQSVRLRSAEVTQTSGFIDGKVEKGFPAYGWLAKDESGDFEFRENVDPKTGWRQNFELRMNGDSGFYGCKIIEPLDLPH